MSGAVDKEVVGESEDRLYVSAEGTLHEGSCNDRKNVGVQEGLSEGAGIWDENADVFHQPRREGSNRGEKNSIGTGEEASFRKNQSAPRQIS